MRDNFRIACSLYDMLFTYAKAPVPCSKADVEALAELFEEADFDEWLALDALAKAMTDDDLVYLGPGLSISEEYHRITGGISL